MVESHDDGAIKSSHSAKDEKITSRFLFLYDNAQTAGQYLVSDMTS